MAPLGSLLGAASAWVFSPTAWLPAYVGKHTLGTKGAPAEVIALADLLPIQCVGFLVGWSGLGSAGCLSRWGSKPGHNVGLVPKGLAPLSECPNIYIVLDDVPTKGRIISSCLAKQAVILGALLGRIVAEEHDQQCLILGHLKGCLRVVHEVAAEEAVPSLHPGAEVSYGPFRGLALVLILGFAQGLE